MKFRVARPDELGDITLLYHEIWHETQAPLHHPDIAKFRDVSFLRERINVFYPNIIIAIDEEKLVGLAVARDARITQLFVDCGLRGKGIGKMLLNLGEAKLIAEGATDAKLNCLVGNHAARRFYERNGWKVSDTQIKIGQTHNGDAKITAWEMVKTLDRLSIGMNGW